MTLILPVSFVAVAWLLSPVATMFKSRPAVTWLDVAWVLFCCDSLLLLLVPRLTRVNKLKITSWFSCFAITDSSVHQYLFAFDFVMF